MRQTLTPTFSISVAIFLLAGCFANDPAKIPAEAIPIATLPDVTIGADRDVEWQSIISFAVGPGIPTQLKFNVNIEGKDVQSVDIVLNFKKANAIVYSCAASHNVTGGDRETLTTPVKLEPGDYDYEALFVIEGVTKTRSGKFHVTSQN